ncbi:MAG: class I SAM-dependent methyltransferase [Salinibacterium sp.]|nr:class I SAM-dependent methyltransferase [Salinibacterium sp.]
MALLPSLVAFASARFPRLSSRVLASSGYTLDLDSFGPDAFGVWELAAAARQDAAWRPLVSKAIAGSPREDVAALWASLAPVVGADTTLLEVGCGGGYNSEAILHRFPGVVYSGLDLAASMIDLAEQHYPDRSFVVGTAYALPFADASQDVVLDGVALIHMPEWKRALAEYARVRRGHVVLHGLTLAESHPTTMFAKYAWGQPSLELVFNRDEIRGECEVLGLQLGDIRTCLDYDLDPYIGIPSVSETWTLS